MGQLQSHDGLVIWMVWHGVTCGYMMGGLVLTFAYDQIIESMSSEI